MNIFLICFASVSFVGYISTQNSISNFDPLLYYLNNGETSRYSVGKEDIVDLDAVIHNFKYLLAPGLASNNTECRRESVLMWNEVRKGSKSQQWAKQMLTSAGDIFSTGALFVSARSSGHYKDCKKISILSEGMKHKIEGRHCNIKFFLDGQGILNAKNLDFIVKYHTSENRDKLADSFTALQRSILQTDGILSRDVCVPASCINEDIENGSELFSSTLGFLSEASVFTCRAEKDSLPLTNSSLVMLSLGCFIVVMVVFFTCLDALQCYKGHAYSSAILKTSVPIFSLATNIEKLLKIQDSELDFFNGIKSICRIWLSFAHIHKRMAETPKSHSHLFYKGYPGWIQLLIFNGPFGVDLYFITSAFFTTISFYPLMKDRPTLSNLLPNILKRYAIRYLKLTIPYAFVVAFINTLFTHLDDGPLYHEGISDSVTNCQTYWMHNLAYANGVEFVDHCIPDNWYLAVDFHMYLLTPFLVAPFIYNAVIGYMLLGCLYVASIVIPFIQEYPFNSVEAHASMAIMRLLRKMNCYVTGFVCAQLFIRKTRIRLSKVTVTVCWCLCVSLLWILLFGGFQSFRFDIYFLFVRNATSYIHIRAFPLCAFWILFAILHNYADLLKEILSWAPFAVLSKILYCTYLCTYPIQIWSLASLKDSYYIDSPLKSIIYFGHLIYTIIAGLLLHLFIQCPSDRIISALFAARNKSKDKVKVG